MQIKIAFVLIAICLISQAFSKTAQDDLIQNMPGYKNYDYKMYSGMLDIAQGSRSLHYVLLESQGNPQTDPLVIWLNGGPGCSSLLGLIQENGPFLFEGINTYLTPNPDFTWNKNANMLYIEGPPGVGFSVNNDKSYKYTDENTGADFLAALVVFKDRFENVLNFSNKLFLSGESYAGMYVPFFAREILNYNQASTDFKFNFAGFLIGNGVFLSDDNTINKFMVDQYVENNFVNNELKKYYYEDCKLDPNGENCETFGDAFVNVFNNTDPYSIYNYTYSYQDSAQKSQFLLSNLKNAQGEPNFMNKLYEKLSKLIEKKKLNQKASTVTTPDDVMIAYFNLKEVKQALHVDENIQWNVCNNIDYHRAKDSTSLYPQFFEAGLDILIFSGNNDAVVPYQYTQYCIQDLRKNYGVSLTENGKWRQWNKLSNKQVGGMVQYYKTNTGSQFIYAMVRAAGHEVPEYQPLSAYHMFTNFINGTPI